MYSYYANTLHAPVTMNNSDFVDDWSHKTQNFEFHLSADATFLITDKISNLSSFSSAGCYDLG